MERAAAGPPLSALAQCSTRSRSPSSGWPHGGGVPGRVDVRVGGAQRGVHGDASDRARRRAPVPPPRPARCGVRRRWRPAVVGQVLRRRRPCARVWTRPVLPDDLGQPGRRSGSGTPCSRCRSAKRAPSSGPRTLWERRGRGRDDGDLGAVGSARQPPPPARSSRLPRSPDGRSPGRAPRGRRAAGRRARGGRRWWSPARSVPGTSSRRGSAPVARSSLS